MIMSLLIKILLVLLISFPVFAGDYYVNCQYSGTENGTISQPYNTVIEALTAITTADPPPYTEDYTVHIRGTKDTSDDGVDLDMTNNFSDWCTEAIHLTSNWDGDSNYSITVKGYASDSHPPVFTLASELSGTWYNDTGNCPSRANSNVWCLNVSAENWDLGTASIDGILLIEDLDTDDTDLNNIYSMETTVGAVATASEFTVTIDGSNKIQRVYMVDAGLGNPNTTGHTYYLSPAHVDPGPGVQFQSASSNGEGQDYWTWENIEFRYSGYWSMQLTGNNITMRDLIVFGAGRNGVRVYSENLDYASASYLVDNCTFMYTHGDNATFGGHGLQFNTSGSTVQNNTFHNNQAGGIIVLGNNNTIVGNTAYSNDNGIYLEQAGSGGSPQCHTNTVDSNFTYDNAVCGIRNSACQSSDVFNNLVINNGQGIAEYGPNCQGGLSGDDCHAKEMNYLNNTIYWDGSIDCPGCNEYGIKLINHNHTGSPKTTIKNNIIFKDNSATDEYHIWYPVTDQVTSDYNIMHATGNWRGRWSGGTTYTSFSSYQTASSQDANSDDSDPLFIDEAGDNFELQGGSPALNTGDDLSAFLTDDYLGVSRPIGSAFDIGAYERAALIIKAVTIKN